MDAYVDNADLYAAGEENKVILNKENGKPKDTSNDNAVWVTKKLDR